MPKGPDKYGSVDASPTKSFFVTMLTKDVTLLDAILDLVDNCVDGILRNHLNAKGREPYKTFFAEIEFDAEQFAIHDNCGGIPWELSEYAFRMGRPGGTPNTDKATVGVYGIGMKRAIFKMGETCLIRTQTKSDAYEISIDKNWLVLESGKTWTLNAVPSKSKMKHSGTSITVSHLLSGVKESFGKLKGAFEKGLLDAIETHYAQILEKGFRITVNKTQAKARPVKLAFSKHLASGVLPYIYETTHNGVSVFLAVGFTRPIPDENEKNIEEVDSRYSKERSGWTIVCNDRVIVYADKTEITGWGVSRVPRYHPQFNAIAGVVEFSSLDASKLPTVTTKRGLDMGSPLYLQVRERMIEGMKLFTDFTNAWKNDLQKAKRLILDAPTHSLSEIREVRSFQNAKFKTAKQGIKGHYFSPRLPLPDKMTSDQVRVSFSRPQKEVERLGEYYFGDREALPSSIGERTFDDALRAAKRL